MNFIIIFIITVALSAFFTFLIKIVALKLDIVDKPNRTRKIHKKNIPLLGGAAIFCSFFLVLFFLKADLIAGELTELHWLGFFIAGSILILGGALDDKFNQIRTQYDVEVSTYIDAADAGYIGKGWMIEWVLILFPLSKTE